MKRQDWMPVRFWQRWGILILGMMSVSSGIALTTLAHLGTTPLSSVPFTATQLTGISLGNTTILMNIFFFIAQWILFGKSFQLKKNLLQVPLVILFGLFIDLAMWAVSFFAAEQYFWKIVQNMAGNAMLALGVVLEISSCTTALPGDGVVIAAGMRFRKPMGRVKLVTDWVLVAIAAVTGLIFAHEIIGLREGTVLSALTVGLFVSLWLRVRAFGKLKSRNEAALVKAGENKEDIRHERETTKAQPL